MKILSQSDWINIDDELINYLSRHNLKLVCFTINYQGISFDTKKFHVTMAHSRGNKVEQKLSDYPVY